MPNANNDLDDVIRRSTQVEVPIEVRERLHRQIAGLRERIEHQRPNRLRGWAEAYLRPLPLRVAAITAAALAVVLALTLTPGGSKANHVYAAAAAEMRAAQSLEYKIVLAPYTEVSFSYLAPAHRRVSCSWGTEIRSDGSGRELVLMHLTRNYAMEEGKQPGGVAESSDLVNGLKSLPKTADEFLGTKEIDGRRLTGYRILHLPEGTVSRGFKAMDLWVNAETGDPDHVDISFQEEGKPLYEMHIKEIHVGRGIDPTVFDMTPPANYTAINTQEGTQHADLQGEQETLRPEIKQSDAMSVVVVSVNSSYPQTRAAMQQVRSWLKEEGVSPSGPPVMKYVSKTEWYAGYPVPGGTPAEKPFRRDDIPASSTASVVVKGPWGEDFNTTWGHDPGSRWASFVMWIGRQGYVPVGPPIEIWSGADTKPSSQSTEMRIAVVRKN
jgi:outer membrane lipoprotein-sorting protein